MRKAKRTIDRFRTYMSCKNLAEKWNLLTASQKKQAAELKREFNWKTTICIQQVYFFNTSVAGERKLFGESYRGHF